MQTRLLQLVHRVYLWIARLIIGFVVQFDRLRRSIQRARSWIEARVKLPRIPLTTLQWFLLLYFVFGLFYLTATPVFEASDELWHFGMVEHLARGGDLPVQEIDGLLTPWRQEGSQPPLYYALSAFLVRWIDLDDVEQFRQPNPHVMAGIPGNYGNKNLVLRHEAANSLEGTALAVTLLRVAGLLMGVVTIWGIHATAKLIFVQRPVIASLAAAITAFNPMFLFISASVNNDNLVTMLNTLAIFLGVWMLRNGFEWRRSLLLALLIALATLTKLSALVLVPVVAITGVYIAWRQRDWRGLLVLGGSMLVIWLVLAGWWYLRNLTLYNELFGTHTMALVAGARTEPFTLGTLLAEFQGFRISYWGLFGAVNIQAAEILYALLDMFVFVALFGTLFMALQLIAIREFSYARRELEAVCFLAAIVLLGLLAFVSWTAQTYASQGRLMFPYLGAISPLLAAGLVEVVWWLLFGLRAPDRSFVRARDAVPDEALHASMSWHWRILGLIAFVVPFTVIAPNYTAPQPLTEIPDDVQSVYARYGDFELVGIRVARQRYYVGDRIPMTLYWRVIQPSSEDYSLSLALLGPDGAAIGKVDSYPGAGTLRTSTWKPGFIYPDTYIVPIQMHEFASSYKLRAQVGWWNIETREFQLIIDEEGRQLDAVLLDIGGMIKPERPDIRGYTPVSQIRQPDSPPAEFERLFRLEALLVNSSSLETFLIWDTLGTPERDYTAFLHVLDQSGQLVGQADIFPSLPTSYWRPWDRVKLEYPVQFDQALQLGTYRVLVGWYENDGDKFPRLMLPAQGDVRLDAYPLFDFEVTESGVLEFGLLQTPETPSPSAEQGASSRTP